MGGQTTHNTHDALDTVFMADSKDEVNEKRRSFKES